MLSQCTAVCTWQWWLALPSRALRGSQDVFLLPCRGCAVGDAFGQRTVRVVHKHSRRRMIMSFVLVSSVQVFVVLGLLQLVLPPSITGDVYIGGEPSTCYVQYFDEGCCPTDGRYTALLVTTRRADVCRCLWLTTSPPWLVCQARRATVSSTARRSCVMHPCSVPIARSGFHVSFAAAAPFLLINGAANTVYYFAESMLYREPLGLVLLVVSSLSATVFFKPVGSIFHLPNSHISPGVLVMGIGWGFVVCGGEGQLQGAWWRGRGWCR